jgi:mitochondrial import receptor subunit TOM40
MTQVADEQGLWMVRLDPGRQSLDGRLHRMLVPLGGWCKVQLSGTPEGDSDQLLAECDVNGPTWSANLKYGSIAGGIVYGCNFYQAITPRLHMGAEGMYVAVNGNQLSNYTIKYTWPASTGDEDGAVVSKNASTAKPGASPIDTGGSTTLVANLNPAQMMATMNVKRVVTPQRVTLGAELQFSPLSLESQVAIGADFNWQKSQLQLCLHGDGRLQSLLDVKLGRAPGSPSLKLSADVNHFTEEMRFGYGITVEG